jgi:hypothetical protein
VTFFVLHFAAVALSHFENQISIHGWNGVCSIGSSKLGFMKNQKPEVKNGSCIDRSHVPLAVLALAAVFRQWREWRGTSRI